MENQKLIKKKQFVVRLFCITLAFVLGYNLAYMLMDKVLNFTGEVNINWENLNEVKTIQTYLWYILAIELVLLIYYYFFALKEKEKKRSPAILDQIEKLGKLKLEGHITDEEFEKEKKKLWEQ